MTYKIKITEDAIEVTTDSHLEALSLVMQLRHQSQPHVLGNQEARQEGKATSMSGRRLLPKWLVVFRAIVGTDEGISSQEICSLLEITAPRGIGRASMPVRSLLSESNIEWEDVIIRVRHSDDLIMWSPGPMIGKAIEIMEEHMDIEPLT